LPTLPSRFTLLIIREFCLAQPTELLEIESNESIITIKHFIFAYPSLLEVDPVTCLPKTVVEASREKPYLNLRIDLDPTLVASVIMESGIKVKKSDAAVKAMDVSSFDADLLDAVVKLVRLLDTPEEMKVLAPLIIHEIVYRLLKGAQGARLSHLITTEGDASRVSTAVKKLREKIGQPLKVETWRANSG